MQQPWSAEELVEHWRLTPEELALLPGKADGGKLGFAVQLAFYKRHARFPDDEADIAPAGPPTSRDRLASRSRCWTGTTGPAARGGAIGNRSWISLLLRRSTRRPRRHFAPGLPMRFCRTSRTLWLWRSKSAPGSLATGSVGPVPIALTAAVWAIP